MLETIREFALERLVQAGERAQAQERHLAYYVALAEQANSLRAGAALDRWYARLDPELDNIRAARSWSRAALNRAEAELRLVGALWWFLEGMGHMAEVRAWLEAAVERRDGVVPQVQALVLLGAGELLMQNSEYRRATTMLRESLALYQANDDAQGVARLHNYLGHLERLQGHYAQVQQHQEACLSFYRGYGDSKAIKGVIWALLMLGDVFLDQCDYRRATACFEEALAHSRSLEDKDGHGWALVTLGRVAYHQSNHALATQFYREALALFQAITYRYGISEVLSDLGDVAAAQGQHEAAMTYYRDSLALCKEMMGAHYIYKCLEGVAGVAGAHGQPERAARLFGAVARLRALSGTPIPPVRRAAYDQAVAVTAAQLDPEAFRVLWAEGRAMTLEQDIAYALDSHV